jgi:ElaB/YqjD/DUF883 family membrane-anchored ribosome-binding protein
MMRIDTRLRVVEIRAQELVRDEPSWGAVVVTVAVMSFVLGMIIALVIG